MSLLSISDQNDKVPFPNISLFPGRDCGEAAKHCGKDCYAAKFPKFYPSVYDAWEKNSKAFREANESGEWGTIRDEISAYLEKVRKHPIRYFRIHVAGDFLSQEHVDLWIAIAEMHPGIKFLAFTKQYRLDFAFCPENLQIVYSMWPGVEAQTPLYAPRAWMQDGTESRIPAGAIACPGNCGNCGMCWSLSELKRDVWFHKH